MTRPLRSAVLAALLVPGLFAGAALADVLYLVDGTTLADVDIESETLAAVTFKQKGKSELQTLEPDKVLSIEYKRLPTLLDEADGLAREGALNDAIDRYNVFVEGIESGENKRDRQAWAPAYAMQRVIELRTSLGDAEGVVKAAEALIAKRPDSRHAPAAQLAKAEALKAQGKDGPARQALDDLRTMIDAKALSKRWTLELQLAEVLFDASVKGQAKRDRLIEIAGQAGKAYPGVANRARVSEGETYLEGSKQDFASARKVFEKILADPKADDATLAGAYTGMGDCLFHEAAGKSQPGAPATAELEAALTAYMRVAVNYRDQTRYAPKAMFYAGRSFDLLGEDENYKANARRLYSAVVQNYPGSEWARAAFPDPVRSRRGSERRAEAARADSARRTPRSRQRRPPRAPSTTAPRRARSRAIGVDAPARRARGPPPLERGIGPREGRVEATLAGCGWTGLIDLEGDLRAFLARRCRDESELDDVVQETFLRAARFRSSVQDTRNLRGWALRIGGNVLRDRQRRESRLPRQAVAGSLDLESLGDPRDPFDEDEGRAVRMGGRWVGHSEAAALLRGALERLEQHDRTVLEAYYGRGVTTPCIALELGLPRELVKVRLFRARRRLMRRLEAAGYAPARRAVR